jgi:hypothetical protein
MAPTGSSVPVGVYFAKPDMYWCMKALRLIVLLFLLTGCGYFPKQLTPVQQHTTAQIHNTNERLQTIGALATGIDVTIPTQPAVAVDLNKKVLSLAEEPSPEQVKQVMDSITNAEAKEALEKQVGDLILEKRKVAEQSNMLINTLTNQNSALSDAKKKADEDLANLRQPTTAIWFGISTLFKRFMWTVIICGVLFLLLRAFAGSHPAIGAVFGIMEHLAAFVIKGVAALFPRMLSFAGTVSSAMHERHNATLEKVVLSIDALKESGDKNITLDDLLTELSKRMNDDEKKVVAEMRIKLR